MKTVKWLCGSVSSGFSSVQASVTSQARVQIGDRVLRVKLLVRSTSVNRSQRFGSTVRILGLGSDRVRFDQIGLLQTWFGSTRSTELTRSTQSMRVNPVDPINWSTQSTKSVGQSQQSTHKIR
ncbi:hypothetical protein Hanom_Chr03g00214371 [Helianthus anomalus]